MTKTNEEWVEEFRKFRTEEISEMFDNVDENGIYPTGKFFIRLDSYVAQLLEAKDKEREEAVAEMVEEVNRSWREDPMTVEHHAKIIAEAVEAEREQFIALVRSEMIKYPDSERIVEDPYNFALMCLENKLNKKQSELDQPNK